MPYNGSLPLDCRNQKGAADRQACISDTWGKSDSPQATSQLKIDYANEVYTEQGMLTRP